MVGLADRRKDKVSTFSGGLKRRLEIGRGLLHSPRVLFLDEPTIGLDPQSRVTLWKYVDQLRVQEDITVFLTTHYMDEAERCDRIAIIDQGEIVVQGSPAGLKASVGQDRIRIKTGNDQAAAETLIITAGGEGDSHQGRCGRVHRRRRGVCSPDFRDRPLGAVGDSHQAHPGRRVPGLHGQPD